MNSMVNIGSIFDIRKGSLQSSKNSEGSYRFITAAQEYKTHNSFTHNCEALVFAAAASGSLGRVHYVNDKFIASDLCFILTPKKDLGININIKFYHIYFNFIRQKIVIDLAKGATKISINKRDFSNYKILILPKDEQDAVVAKAGKMINLCDELEEKFTSILSATQQLLQKTLRKYFEHS